MSIRSLAARGLSFAHLAGVSAKAAKSKAEDDEDKKDAKAEGDSDDEEKNQDRDDGDARAEDDEDETKDDDKKSGKAKSKAKAEDDEEDKDYAEDDDDEARAEDDDEDDEEMRGKSAAARARRREQARCAAIMGHKSAARNVELAANLAFNTRMTRQEALAILKATPAAVSPSHGRASRNPNLGAGGDASRGPAAVAATGWDRAFAKVTKASGKRA